MNRLESVSKKLSNKILKADDKKQKEIILISCKYAINKSKLYNTLISEILENYMDGNLKTSYKEKLEVMLEDYENNYFDLQETGENYLITFAKARTISVILYCFDEDLVSACLEAVYEASVVSEDNYELFCSVEKILGN